MLIQGDIVAQFVANALLSGARAGLLGLSFGLVYATTRFFNFAHGSVFLIGAYAVYALATLGVDPAVASSVAILIAGSIGALFNAGLFSPLRAKGRNSTEMLLVSIGVFIVVQALISIVFGPALTAPPGGSSGSRIVSLGGAHISVVQLLSIICSVAAYAAVALLVGRTNLGRTIRALRDDMELADAFGVGTKRVATISVFLGSLLAGLAAVLTAYDTGVRPTIGFSALLVGVIAAVVGGTGSIAGAFYGGFAIGLAQQIGAWLLPSRWQDAVAYLILVLVLLVRPGGDAVSRPAARAV